jgi:uncharacterized membrane protein (Fun14 family)
MLLDVPYISIGYVCDFGCICSMEYKMNQEFILNMTTIGGGFLIGMLTGYFLRKVLRLVMFALGGVFSLAMYLQYQGLITINLDKIQNYIDKIASTVLNSISIISRRPIQYCSIKHM